MFGQSHSDIINTAMVLERVLEDVNVLGLESGRRRVVWKPPPPSR